MRFLTIRVLVAVALSSLLVVGLMIMVTGYGAGEYKNVALASGPPPMALYTVSTEELAIPVPGDGTGNLQANVLCGAGDLATGGGHIIHPSSTTDVFVTKSYATDATGSFAPAAADRWRAKVLNPNDLANKRLTVHVVCADVTPPFGP